jgi:hypothetical protein
MHEVPGKNLNMAIKAAVGGPLGGGMVAPRGGVTVGGGAGRIPFRSLDASLSASMMAAQDPYATGDASDLLQKCKRLSSHNLLSS